MCTFTMGTLKAKVTKKSLKSMNLLTRKLLKHALNDTCITFPLTRRGYRLHCTIVKKYWKLQFLYLLFQNAPPCFMDKIVTNCNKSWSEFCLKKYVISQLDTALLVLKRALVFSLRKKFLMKVSFLVSDVKHINNWYK